VKHSDFLPEAYCPTFSSFPTSMNLHRIDGIADHFVLFDDDMFLSQKTERVRFFKNGLPVDTGQLTVLAMNLPFGHYNLNCMSLIHKRHNLRKQILHHPSKWFNYRYGLGGILKTLSLLPWTANAAFKNPHVPIPFLKSAFEKLWDEEFELLDATGKSKFRSHADLSAWLMRYEQLASGNFYPTGIKDTHTDMITDKNAENIAAYITEQKYRLFCLNDSNDIADFEKTKNTINAAFEKILPEKCSFEL
jgi:hypothetical protein